MGHPPSVASSFHAPYSFALAIHSRSAINRFVASPRTLGTCWTGETRTTGAVSPFVTIVRHGPRPQDAILHKWFQATPPTDTGVPIL